MRRGFGFVIAWVGATLLAVVIATAAVGSVRSQVTDAPTPLSSPGARALAETPIAQADPSSTTTTTMDTTPDVTSTTIDDIRPTTTTTTPTATTVPGTTVPPVTVTTTTATNTSKTVDTVAGSVRIVVSGGAVSFGGAYPNPGWKVELDDAGPEVVKVKFERNEGDGEVEVTAKVEGGELQIYVDDHTGESHDD
jgi:hypothetical protein